ncbi:hypothetical protein MTO96_013280 [Rhipicephalus appendiculatus]
MSMGVLRLLCPPRRSTPNTTSSYASNTAASAYPIADGSRASLPCPAASAAGRKRNLSNDDRTVVTPPTDLSCFASRPRADVRASYYGRRIRTQAETRLDETPINAALVCHYLAFLAFTIGAGNRAFIGLAWRCLVEGSPHPPSA